MQHTSYKTKPDTDAEPILETQDERYDRLLKRLKTYQTTPVSLRKWVDKDIDFELDIK